MLYYALNRISLVKDVILPFGIGIGSYLLIGYEKRDNE